MAASDPIPSLSELSHGNTDPEIASGTPANVINNQAVAEGLMRSAEFRSQNTFNRYAKELENFKDVFKDAQDIASLETRPTDTPDLKKRMGETMGKITQNPHGFFGGNMAEVEKELLNIKQDAVKSKQAYAFDNFNREQRLKDPTLDTPENNSVIDNSEKTPINQWKPYMLKIPPAFDFNTFKAGILKQATKGTTSDEIGGMAIDKDGKQVFDTNREGYIRTTTGSTTSKDNYVKLWDAGWDTEHDQYGHPLRDIVTGQYNDLVQKNPNIKKQFPTPKDYYHWLGESSFGSDKDIQSDKTVKLTPDANYLGKQKLALEQEKIGIELGRLNLDKQKEKDLDTIDVLDAGAVVGEAAHIINNGLPIVEKGTDKAGGENLIQIGDPDILKTFSTIDKDGKITESPNVLNYNTDKGQINLTYYAKEDDTTKPITSPSGTITGYEQKVLKDKYGDPIVEKRIPMDERTFLSEIVKRDNPNKDIGKINAIVDKALKANGNSLFKLSQNYTKDQNAPKEVQGNIDPSTLSDGAYILNSGKNKGKTVTIKDGQAVSIQ